MPLPNTTVSSLREQDLPGHLRGAEEKEDGFARGVVIAGEEAIGKALERLKADAVARAPGQPAHD